MRTAVIDSGPLISLVHLELAKELALYFDVIYVPRAVQVEVNRKQRFRYRLQKLYKTGVFVRCGAADEVNVGLLRHELDAGEAEGLVQAQERNAAVFIGDESRAREISSNYGLKPVGTVRLLARLHLERRAEETATLARKLQRDLNFRVSDEILAAAIAMAPEPI
jgi:predicted nucleic acid-binding protein